MSLVLFPQRLLRVFSSGNSVSEGAEDAVAHLHLMCGEDDIPSLESNSDTFESSVVRDGVFLGPASRSGDLKGREGHPEGVLVDVAHTVGAEIPEGEGIIVHLGSHELDTDGAGFGAFAVEAHRASDDRVGTDQGWEAGRRRAAGTAYNLSIGTGKVFEELGAFDGVRRLHHDLPLREGQVGGVAAGLTLPDFGNHDGARRGPIRPPEFATICGVRSSEEEVARSRPGEPEGIGGA